MAFRDDHPNISPARRRLGITTKAAPPRSAPDDDIINLDHLLLFFDDPNQSRPSSRANSPTRGGSGQGERIKTTTYSLTQFLSAEGRRSRIRTAADYDYNLFRNKLRADLQIPVDATLHPPVDSGLPDITHRVDFLYAIAELQGAPNIVGSARDDLPTLVLWWNPAPQTPSGSPASPAMSPASPMSPPSVPVPVPPPVQVPVTPSARPAPVQTPVPPLPVQSSAPSPSPPSSGRMSIDMTPGQGSDGVPASEMSEEEVPEDDQYGTIMRNLHIDFDEDENLWAEICRFFRCDIDAQIIQVPGILLALRPYQAYAVWRILTQFTRGYASYMNSDDVGLGKTGVTLCVIAIFHQLHGHWRAAQRERQRAVELGVERIFLPAHLPRDELQGDDDVCPTQRGRLQCPCKKDTVARQVVELLADRPTLIVVPPELVGNWVSEAEKWIDRRQGSPSVDIRWYVLHKSWANQREGRIAPDQLDEMKATPINDGNNKDQKKYLNYVDDRPRTRYIVIVSRAGMGRLQATFDPPGFKRSERAAKFVPSFVFFDEFHNYCGGRDGGGTEPFRYLNETRFYSHKPIAAIGISGSCRSNPRTWRRFIEHAFDIRRRRQAEPFRIAGMRRISDFDKYERIWDRLINKFDTAAATDIEQLTNFLKDFIPLMVLARKKADTFRGGRILELPMNNPVWISCNMGDGEIRTAFKHVTSSVGAWIKHGYDAHQRKEADKQARGQEADLVTATEYLTRIHETLLEDGQDIGTRDPKGLYQLAKRASTFPAVAFLVIENKVDGKWTLVKAFAGVSEKMSKRLFPPAQARLRDTKESALRHLREPNVCPWWEHRGKLLSESPKFERIRYTIDNILLPQSQLAPDDPGVDGTPPVDGTNIRHALIFANTPLSALLITMLLLDTYRDNDGVAIIYLHSRIPAAERANYVNYMQQDCNRGDPVKIMVSTLDLMGVGHNIQRVNTVIITDVPSTEAEQNQAFGRVNRLGQTMELGLYQLFDENNIAEEIWRKRLDNRVKLTRIGYDDFGIPVQA